MPLGFKKVPRFPRGGDEPLIDIPQYWLVDPLDGIKDFIATNDEFTVNDALIDGGRPVLGVVFVAALKQLSANQSGIVSLCEKACIPNDC